MLARHLNKSHIGKRIRFRNGTEFSNPDFEFEATLLDVKYEIELDVILTLNDYEDNIDLRKELLKNMDNIEISMPYDYMLLSIDNVLSRYKNNDEWNKVRHNGITTENLAVHEKVEVL